MKFHRTGGGLGALPMSKVWGALVILIGSFASALVFTGTNASGATSSGSAQCFITGPEAVAGHQSNTLPGGASAGTYSATSPFYCGGGAGPRYSSETQRETGLPEALSAPTGRFTSMPRGRVTPERRPLPGGLERFK